MNKIEILGGLLKRIDNFNMSNLDGRIVFQKTIYFLQEFKVNLGYGFSWYIYGPYSTSLAMSGFELIKKMGNLSEIKFTKKEYENNFQQFLIFLGSKKNDSNWLELLASLHFLKKIYPTESKEQIIARVMKKQPYLNKKEFCETGWKYLKEFKLVE